MTNQDDYTLAFIELDEIIAKLTEPYSETLYTNNGQETQATGLILMPPMLQQLAEAIGSSTTIKTPGLGSANTRAILDFSALALVNEINRQMRTLWELSINSPRPKNLVKTIKRWQAYVHHLGPNQDLDNIKDAIKTMNHWINQIDLKFDPPVVLDISQPCPNCHVQRVENSEQDLIHSVRIIWRRSFDSSKGECLNCHKTWVGERELRQLRWELDHDTPEPD
jgi:hypothetical protein